MPSQPPTTSARIAQIRNWIAASDREGTARSDVQLQLSDRDLASLKRSPDVRVDEISFANGVTTFLGVQISEAGGSSSGLAPRAPA